MVVCIVVTELVPNEVRNMLLSGLRSLRSRVSSQHTLIIDETEGLCTNNIYTAARSYLATRFSTDMRRLRVSRVDEAQNMMITIEQGKEMVDVYDGTEFRWRLVSRPNSSAGSRTGLDGTGNANRGVGGRLEIRSFELSFHRKHKEKALKSYLPFIMAMAKAMRDKGRRLKMYMVEYDAWTAIDLHHPSTFDTLAMDRNLKQSVLEDLERFVKRKDYYKRIGKASKRGYLLYGPPGTGKSSLIAAMANDLKFDIYALEITSVRCNSDLRRLLVGMTNRSTLFVEDIDCSIELPQREEGETRVRSRSKGEDDGDDKVTLSGLLNFVDGLLNFVDGLWSTSGEERIINFTTNYNERLDPALLRPGRMDMHIDMAYCTTESFRILAANYHSMDYHVTYPEIEELMRDVTVTPAEVAEVLMRNDDANLALEELVEFLKAMRKGADKRNAANEHMEKIDVKQTMPETMASK